MITYVYCVIVTKYERHYDDPYNVLAIYPGTPEGLTAAGEYCAMKNITRCNNLRYEVLLFDLKKVEVEPFTLR